MVRILGSKVTPIREWRSVSELYTHLDRIASGNYPPYAGPPPYSQMQSQPQHFPSGGQSGPMPRGFSGPPPVPRDTHPGHNQQQWGAYPGQPTGGYVPPPSGNYPPPLGPPGNYPPPVPPGNYPPPAGPPGNYLQSPGPPTNYPPPSGPPGAYGQPAYNPPPGLPGGYGYAPGPSQRNPSYTQSGPPMPPAQHQFYGPQMQGPNNQVQQPFFQYSQCTGKKRALCIGINYFNQSAQLAGCINDANNLKAFLMSHFGYREENIRVLTDDSPDPRRWPSRRNMLDHMQWLVHDAQPNDSFFFHYSGHGGQTKDLDGDEEDGYDEVIYPADHQIAGHIVDDLMHDIMVRPLPPGCRLTAIFDSCHSGTALDLPYVYSTEGKIKEPNIAAEAGMGMLSAVTSYARGDVGGIFRSVTGLIKTASGSSKKAEQYARATKTSPADCISFSGCKDSQTSADTQMVNKATGAMSFAFVQAIKRNPRQSYQQLLVSIR
ncbi:putative metacaspase [Pisolithus sp. B1]|nr:putative metacaspase [Pisolithus sp. B1]